MNKNLKFTAIILVAIVAFVGVYFLYDSLSDKYSPEALVTENKNDSTTVRGSAQTAENKPSYNAAPDFSVIDSSGHTMKLSDLWGKPVVLNFWATWCYYCKQEMPDFDAMYKKYGDSVQFVMVNVTDNFSETVEIGKQHIIDNGYTFPVYFDTEGQAARAYNISGLPATYFIDADGNIVSRVGGMLDSASLESSIKAFENQAF